MGWYNLPMSIKMPENYAGRAFLGKEGANPEFQKKVFDTAKKIEQFGILKSTTDPAWKFEQSQKIIKELWSSNGQGPDSVAKLIATTKDRNRVVNKPKAEECIDVLGKAVYLVSGLGDDQNKRDMLGYGSTVMIDREMPAPFVGIGEIVRKNIVYEPAIVANLNDLDKVRKKCNLNLPRDRDYLTKQIEEHYDKLMDISGLDKEGLDQLDMVKSYLNTELGGSIQPASQTDRTGAVNEPGVAAVRGQKNPINPKPFGVTSENESIASPIVTAGDLEGLNRIESIQGMKDWMVRTLLRMSENPTAFANWWQQSMVDSLTREGQSRLGLSDFDKETLDLRAFGFAVAGALGMQLVDRNADANSDNYGQFAPPKNMAAQLHWDDGGEKYKKLREDTVIDTFMRKIMANGFDNNTGWQVVQAFSGGKTFESQNDYLRKLLNNPSDTVMVALRSQGVSEDLLMSKGRVAMAMFEVDWLPEMIRVMNERKREFALGLNDQNGKPARDVPWLQSFNDDYFQRIAAEGKTQAAKDRYAGLRKFGTFSYSGKLVAVATDSNGRQVKTSLGYDHPRVFRPWEVAAGAKQAYRHRPEVIWRMEEVLSPLIDRKLLDGGKCVRMSVQDAADRYLKLGKSMFEMLGGPQALEWDNLTNMDKTVPLLANTWGEGANGSKEFGNCVADIFAAKTDAMFFPGYSHNGEQSFNKIAGLDRESEEKEKTVALDGILGPSAKGAHGFAAEMNRVYHIDLLGMHIENGKRVNDYPQFYNAYIRVQMDEPDSKLAWEWYNKALNELQRNNAIGAVSGGFGMFKTIFNLK